MPRRLLWLVSVALLAASAAQATPPPAQHPAGPISVHDDTGRAVKLAQPARRIVALSPHATELVFAAGAGDRLVAVAPYSDFPAAARKLPRAGGFGGLDREQLLALAPDLVIAWASGNKPADLAWLAASGIPVYLSEPHKLGDIARTLTDIGQLAGTATTARAAADRYRAALAKACPARSQPTPGAFLQLAQRPLLTIGGGHWLDQAMSAAGLHNVFARLPARVVAIGPEALAAAQPLYVLYLAHPGATAPRVRPGQRVIPLDADTWARPGPRLPAAIAALCRALPRNGSADEVISAAGQQQTGDIESHATGH